MSKELKKSEKVVKENITCWKCGHVLETEDTPCTCDEEGEPDIDWMNEVEAGR